MQRDDSWTGLMLTEPFWLMICYIGYLLYTWTNVCRTQARLRNAVRKSHKSDSKWELWGDNCLWLISCLSNGCWCWCTSQWGKDLNVRSLRYMKYDRALKMISNALWSWHVNNPGCYAQTGYLCTRQDSSAEIRSNGLRQIGVKYETEREKHRWLPFPQSSLGSCICFLDRKLNQSHNKPTPPLNPFTFRPLLTHLRALVHRRNQHHPPISLFLSLSLSVHC